jgi:hypothetical protein
MSLKNPNWFDRQDRESYEQLFYMRSNGNDMSEDEWEFCKTMYHMEEYACGLDGD